MKIGRIEYTVWSEVFTCPDCAGEVVFLDEALDKETKRVKDVFPCPHCGSELTKHRMERCFETRFDPSEKDRSKAQAQAVADLYTELESAMRRRRMSTI